MKSRFIYIIMSIIAVMLISPYIQQAGKSGHIIYTLLLTLVPLSSFYSLVGDKNRAIVILFLAAPFVILHGIDILFTDLYLEVFAFGFGVILYLYIIVLLVMKLLSYRAVTANLIYSAIAAYLMIGVMWAGIYNVLEGISPGSIVGISQYGDLIYFSFVTLTTLGFGDITPQAILSKRLAVLEAVMGSIYLSVVIAIIVGRYILMQVERDSERETNLKK